MVLFLFLGLFLNKKDAIMEKRRRRFSMKRVKIIHTKIGKIAIVEENGEIVELKINQEVEKDLLEQETDLLKETAMQLEEYFAGKRKIFEIPLNPKGTPFMKKVWISLQKIPYGEVRTYRTNSRRNWESKSSKSSRNG